MKRWFLVIFLAAGLGMAASGGYYVWQRPALPEGTMSELEWLRQEFNLDDQQFARISAIHAQYEPVCEYFCARVLEAQERLERKMLNAESFTPELNEELAHFSRVKEECHRAMLKHVYEVAEIMAPEERLRYIHKAKGQVLMHDRLH